MGQGEDFLVFAAAMCSQELKTVLPPWCLFIREQTISSACSSRKAVGGPGREVWPL